MTGGRAAVRGLLVGLVALLACSAPALGAVTLDFGTAVTGTVADKDGQGTGFADVTPNAAGTQYEPTAIDLDPAAGRLTLTALTGSNTTNNSLRNQLTVPFDGTATETISARLVGPLTNLTASPQQGGIVFGPSQDDYIKLVATRGTTANQIQFYREVGSSRAQVGAVSFDAAAWAAITTLDLYLVLDGPGGTVRAEYAVNGGARQAIPQTYTVPAASRAAFFNPASQAGILAFTSSAATVPVTFDRFAVGECVAAGGRPSVTQVDPAAGATGVPTGTAVTAEVSLPNCGGIDRDSVASGTVRLIDTTTSSIVPAVVNTSGGGDVIVLQPTVALQPTRTYRFEVDDDLIDLSGAQFQPFTSTFTTGTGPGGGGGTFTGTFTRSVTSAPDLIGGIGYTGVAVGPDHRLYASTNSGLITRFPINADGSLGTGEEITSLQSHEGGPRILIGMAFDPASTPSNPILWVSHNQFTFSNATEWTGKVSRLSGPGLGTVTDVLTGLPRSARDHLTNSLAFHNGLLYFTQGSNSAMGAPDNGWSQRPERVLNAAVLRLDPSKLPGTLPLDVRTADGGGTYNPYGANAALTLYATGVRNAYDLVWHTNGQLYVPTNGSAAGGITPATPSPLPAACSPRPDGAYTGPTVTSITNAGAQPDYLFRVVQGGYYGHPNPSRCEWVLGGGDPGAGVDPFEVPAYPNGTLPDRNYRGAAFNFGLHFSPNGAVEYRGGAFGGSLAGTLLVVRYSAGDDVIALTPNGGNGDIATSQTGITGLTGLVNPLDITEDVTTGNLYIAEYPDPSKSTAPSRIVLARPDAPPTGDTTPPSLTARTPAVGATGVAVGSNVTATFDEALAAASVTTSSVTLVPTAGGAAIPAAVSLGSGGTVITLNPTVDLAAGTQYTATLTTAIEDVAGNNLPSSINWPFTTAPGGPGPGSGAFLPSGGQVVMEAESFTTNTPRGTDAWTSVSAPPGLVGTAMASGPDNGSGSGTPIPTTSPELTYLVDFPSAGTWHVWVRGYNPDTAGNSVHIGLDGATQAASADLTNTTFGSWLWFRGRTASPTARITVPSAGVHTVNVWMREDGFVLDRLLLTTNATYTPTGTGPAESPRDGGGDTSPPSLTARTPAVGAVGVAVGANVTATFDEALAPASVTTSSVTLTPTAGGAAVPAAVSLGSGGTVITLNPTADLAAGTQYTATLTTAIEDVAGNNLPASINWSFTTASSGGGGPFLGAGGLVVMEAEDAQARIARGADAWNPASPAGASGTALAAGPDDGTAAGTPVTTTSAELRFDVVFDQPGTYHVWVRGLAPNTAGNSLHVGLDGAEPTTAAELNTATFGSLLWFRTRISGPTARISVPSAGLHTVHVWMREDGFVLDRLLLTTDATLTPSGAGPAASPRG